MSTLKQIYAVKPSAVYSDDQYCEVSVHILYGGKYYRGEAKLHPEDAHFFSHKVGKHIAESRARIQILKDETERVKKEWHDKSRFYREVIRDKEPAAVDPTGAFSNNMMRAYKRYYSLNQALKREKAHLRIYIESQDKAISSVKSLREKQKAGNTN